MKCGRGGQDGGVRPEKARQGGPTVPEEQGVPGQEAGAEVRFTHQDRDLEEICFTLSTDIHVSDLQLDYQTAHITFGRDFCPDFII